jgi:hypothetical protein
MTDQPARERFEVSFRCPCCQALAPHAHSPIHDSFCLCDSCGCEWDESERIAPAIVKAVTDERPAQPAAHDFRFDAGSKEYQCAHCGITRPEAAGTLTMECTATPTIEQPAAPVCGTCEGEGIVIGWGDKEYSCPDCKPAAQSERTVWMIERGQAQGQYPTVWAEGDRWGMSWTTDPNRAKHFLTKSYAEDWAKSKALQNYVITEHQWIEAKPAAQSEREAWQLVPREPTAEMDEAGAQWVKQSRIRTECYRAMLAAAPQPPEPGRLSGEREALCEAAAIWRKFLGDGGTPEMQAAGKRLYALATDTTAPFTGTDQRQVREDKAASAEGLGDLGRLSGERKPMPVAYRVRMKDGPWLYAHGQDMASVNRAEWVDLQPLYLASPPAAPQGWNEAIEAAAKVADEYRAACEKDGSIIGQGTARIIALSRSRTEAFCDGRV